MSAAWNAFASHLSSFAAAGGTFVKTVAFLRDGTIVYSNAAEARSVNLVTSINRIGDVEAVFERGVHFVDENYDIHQHHRLAGGLSLIWGRGVEAESPGKGLAICQVKCENKTAAAAAAAAGSTKNKNKKEEGEGEGDPVPDLFLLVTYVLPTTSAYAVSRLVKFCQELRSAMFEKKNGKVS